MYYIYMSSPGFAPPKSSDNKTREVIPSNVASNNEAKENNKRQERYLEDKNVSALEKSLKVTANYNKKPPTPASVTPASVTPTSTPAPGPGTDLDNVLQKLKSKYDSNNSTLLALQSKLNDNLSSINALRISASDGTEEAKKIIDSARKKAEEGASKEIQNLSDQLNKINFKPLNESIFNLQTEETKIQNAIEEINKTKDNKTKDDISVNKTNPLNADKLRVLSKELGGGKRKTKRRRSRKNSKKSKRRSKRH